jgi:hypothetical protein
MQNGAEVGIREIFRLHFVLEPMLEHFGGDGEGCEDGRGSAISRGIGVEHK